MDVDSVLFNSSVVGSQVEKLAESVNRSSVDSVDDARKKKVAKDFESILIHQMLNVMKSSIPESEDIDPSSKQIKSMYWSYMADALSEQGGFGLWEQIYQDMSDSSGVSDMGAEVVGNKLDESA